MVGRIKDITGSTTPALYVIGGLGLLCAAILMYGLPATLRRKEERMPTLKGFATEAAR